MLEVSKLPISYHKAHKRQNYKLNYNWISILINPFGIQNSTMQTVMQTITMQFMHGPNSPNVSLYIMTFGLCPNCSMSTILTTTSDILCFCRNLPAANINLYMLPWNYVKVLGCELLNPNKIYKCLIELN